MSRNEWIALAPLIVLVVGLGVYPGPVLELIAAPVERIIEAVERRRRGARTGCGEARGEARLMDYVDDLVTLLPELILTMLVLVVITVDLFLPRNLKWILTPLTVAGLILAGAACVVVWGVNETVYNGFYVVDDLGVFLKAVTIVIGILSTLFAPAYLVARKIPLGEFNTILVTALIGMCILASASDLITLFLGLELMVMPSYLLTGLHKTDRYSNEGGLKYFLLGSFAIGDPAVRRGVGLRPHRHRRTSRRSPWRSTGRCRGRCWWRSAS